MTSSTDSKLSVPLGITKLFFSVYNYYSISNHAKNHALDICLIVSAQNTNLTKMSAEIV